MAELPPAMTPDCDASATSICASSGSRADRARSLLQEALALVVEVGGAPGLSRAARRRRRRRAALVDRARADAGGRAGRPPGDLARHHRRGARQGRTDRHALRRRSIRASRTARACSAGTSRRCSARRSAPTRRAACSTCRARRSRACSRDEERDRAEIFARHLAPLVDRLLLEHRRQQRSDPTRAAARDAAARRRHRPQRGARRRAAAGRRWSRRSTSTCCSPASRAPARASSRASSTTTARAPRRPFVELNCAALPGDAGRERAVRRRCRARTRRPTRKIEGKVAAAEGGTLFLDEIGELSPAAQAKLLQLLQSQQYYPLGATTAGDAPTCASSPPPTPTCSRRWPRRRFREDLFYRLQVLPIRMPALAERREDIAELAASLLRRGLRAPPAAAPRAVAGARSRAVEAAEWPGNVRQLAHADRGGGDPRRRRGRVAGRARASLPGRRRAAAPSRARRRPSRRRRAASRPARCARRSTRPDWNVVETARRLDLARSHVYNLIRAFGLERSER